MEDLRQVNKYTESESIFLNCSSFQSTKMISCENFSAKKIKENSIASTNRVISRVILYKPNCSE